MSEPSAEILADGLRDLSLGLGANFIPRVDAGKPVVIVAGGHVGCYELFGTNRIRSIKDLKGRAVAVPSLGSGAHVFLSMMFAHVGLDPRKDVRWITVPTDEAMRILVQEKVDYDRWREYDPEDTIRVYALCLHEIGMIKSSPRQIIAQGTDWRFLNELRRELRG